MVSSHGTNLNRELHMEIRYRPVAKIDYLAKSISFSFRRMILSKRSTGRQSKVKRRITFSMSLQKVIAVYAKIRIGTIRKLRARDKRLMDCHCFEGDKDW
jgi:hypothetical protein